MYLIELVYHFTKFNPEKKVKRIKAEDKHIFNAYPFPLVEPIITLTTDIMLQYSHSQNFWNNDVS